MKKLGKVMLLSISVIILTSITASSQMNTKIIAPMTVISKQNNPGYAANNFTYTMVNGLKKKLYAINTNYILLFFYNPECDACKVYREVLVQSKVINDQIKKGMMKVLAVYIDKNLSVWKKHLPEMPKSWIHGRDENEYLFKNNVYDLHAIPTIYLLDGYKNVILKDVLDVRLIEKELMK